ATRFPASPIAVGFQIAISDRTPKGTRMTSPDDITFFSAVDRTKEPNFFKRFLEEGNRLPRIIASKPIILAGLQLTAAERVLGVGCGVGDDAFDLARVVGSGGRVVGVDISESMINAARDRASVQNLAVEFEMGDAQALHFADETFDACRTERMLMHVPD